MPTRLAAPIAILALAAALLAGCGSSGGSTGTSAAGTSAPATGITSGGAPAGASTQSCDTQASGAEALRASGVGCGPARAVMLAWRRDPACAPAAGASRSGCTVRSYRCLGVLSGKGVSVSCAQPGRAIDFIAKRS